MEGVGAGGIREKEEALLCHALQKYQSAVKGVTTKWKLLCSNVLSPSSPEPLVIWGNLGQIQGPPYALCHRATQNAAERKAPC